MLTNKIHIDKTSLCFDIVYLTSVLSMMMELVDKDKEFNKDVKLIKLIEILNYVF